jgi:protein-disulfide isomerase
MSSPASVVDRTLSLLLTGAALTLSAVFVHDRLGAEPFARQNPRPEPAEYFPQWRDYTTSGIRMGPDSAPLTIIALSDFECPFCRRLAKDLQYIRENHPTTVSVVFLHHPLGNHRFAEPAARAAECAHAQGRFEPFHDLLFANQDSLGLKSWSAFATQAGVLDTVEFERCRLEKGHMKRVEAGLDIGKEVGLRGTPTVLLNGWRLAHPPSLRELEKSVQAVTEGRPPIGSTR